MVPRAIKLNCGSVAFKIRKLIKKDLGSKLQVIVTVAVLCSEKYVLVRTCSAHKKAMFTVLIFIKFSSARNTIVTAFCTLKLLKTYAGKDSTVFGD